MRNKNITTMVECAIMVALATVLSILKLVDMPYGGSVTLAAMLPVAIVAYRHGIKYGMSTALVASLLQLLLGIENFSYVTGWQSYIALAVFDYLIAYLAFGLGGIFKQWISSPALSLTAGATLSNLIRYVCHVISGATVWAGLPVPDGAALVYSLSYNATYMIPETIVMALCAIYLGSAIDFSAPIPRRKRSERVDALSGYCYMGAGLVALAGLITDTALIFSKLQDSESGEFALAGLSSVNWTAFVIVTAVFALVAGVLLLIPRYVTAKGKK